MGIPLATAYKAGLLSPRDKQLLDKLGLPSVLDYTPQPLPLFGVWSNYNNTNYGLKVFDSNLDLTGGTNQTNYPNFGGEIVSAITSFLQTTARVGTSGVSTAAMLKATYAQSADGNLLMSAAADGTWIARNPTQGDNAQYVGGFGVIVGQEGYRQNFSLTQRGYTLGLNVRGKILPLSGLALTSSYGTFAGTAAPGSNAEGMVGYNRATGVLAMLEPTNTNGTTYRLHIWKNPKRLLQGRRLDLLTFISEAKAGTNGASYAYANIAFTQTSAVAEGQYRARVIPGHNGKIAVVRMLPTNRVEIGTYNTATSAWSVKTQTNVPSLGATSYGWSSGFGGTTVYGMKHMVSWDNRYVACYCASYYYGSGLAGFIVSVDDPDNYWQIYNNSSADGVQIVPFGESSFLQSMPYNADNGVGLTACLYSPQQLSAVPVGAQVSGAFIDGMFDTDYTSTNYPCLVAVDRWSMPGFAGQAG